MINTTHLSLYVTSNALTMAEAAAQIIVTEAEKAIAERGIFTLALSGGKTPQSLFQLLASPQWSTAIDWSKCDIYWVDERCVGPESLESNYHLARQDLLARVAATRFYRIKGEEQPESAADAYEKLLIDHFKLEKGEFPRFDCVLLGVGGDGHTGSLFPDDPAIDEKEHSVVAVRRKQGPDRITLTLPVLNNARCCIFMASGREKNHVLSTALNLMAAPILPAQMVRPHAGRLCWIIDDVAYQG